MKLSALHEKLTRFKATRTIALAQAADPEVLKAVKHTLDMNLAGFRLFGDAGHIRTYAEEVGLDLDQGKIEVFHTENFEEAAQRAVQDVHQKKADVLMKGNLSTKQILKQVLNKEHGLRTSRVLSHVAVFEIPEENRLIYLTDAAMNLTPDLKTKAEIIQNAVDVYRKVDQNTPKVAALAAVEVVNPSMPATIDAAALSQMQKRGQIKDCIVDGPLAFDNAVSVQSVHEKGIKSEVAGQADILVVPELETGNALYKSFIYFAGAKVASVISGATAPIVLTSRSDTHESKLYSIILGLLTAEHNK
ncbi:phosphate butyryltransferase [Virgibacillus sp. MSP4-1]|uniref:phosphate butyryltransferase n=1 Tax=Virgibacillus sp. MSP4-1 TaxID=2700081 RepID=UPI00039C49C2|nr:phosphate butyryltransferase [Virgibacillus sp. MSP4-1]QHS22689.1 phosphate butyryltransferase [Virgibacillus sp. MSP4-1]